MKTHPIWCKTHTKNLALLHAIEGVPDGTNVAHYIWCALKAFFFTVHSWHLKEAGPDLEGGGGGGGVVGVVIPLL